MLAAVTGSLLAIATTFGSSRAHPLLHEASALQLSAAVEPCRFLRDTVQAWFDENHIVPKNLSSVLPTLIPAVPAAPVKPSVAFACLKSIPLDRDKALGQIQALRPFFEWQSTLDYNKKPPRGYLSEGIDLFRGLDELEEILRADFAPWPSLFDFLAELQTVKGRVRDGHFGSVPLLLGLVTLQPGVEFVSISQDGEVLPEIFLYGDLKHHTDKYQPSPVSTIDGVPALEYMQRLAVRDMGSHDPDARYNGLFPSLAKEASLFSGKADIYSRWGLNDTTTIVCHNGTSITFNNIALVGANLTNITSGADLYRDFVLTGGEGPIPPTSAIYRAAERGYAGNFSTGGFPKPVSAAIGGDIAGFLPDVPGFEDTAVLVINSFSSSVNITELVTGTLSTIPLDEQSRVSLDFLKKAKAAGRTRLVIDLQGNGGGFIPSLGSVYFNLFPGQTLPIQSQLRVHQQMAEMLLHTPQSNTTNTTILGYMFGIYRQLNGSPFPSPSALLGPVTTEFGNTTNPAVWDTNYYLNPAIINYTLPWSTPPFVPENITVLTDGICASCCATFVGVLAHTHGVRTVVVGGRPLLKPMQAVGRTKGGPNSNLGGLPAAVNRSIAFGADLVVPTPGPIRLATSLTGRSNPSWFDGISVNLGNMAPVGDKPDAIPNQFRYEAANCKLFFTWEMARDIKAIWRKVIEVSWKGGKCVEGSTTQKGGKMGGIPEYNVAVEDKYTLGGPGAV